MNKDTECHEDCPPGANKDDCTIPRQPPAPAQGGRCPKCGGVKEGAWSGRYTWCPKCDAMSCQRPAPAQDTIGLVGKYRITKADGSPKRTWCFVLSPEKEDTYGIASRRAMIQYARDIEVTNPTLARDMRDRVLAIQERLREEPQGQPPAPAQGEDDEQV